MERHLSCVDKFGRMIEVPKGQVPYLPGRVYYMLEDGEQERFDISEFFELQRPDLLFEYLKNGIRDWDLLISWTVWAR
ncbi:MAG: hypothetical protein JRJ66_17370 [Deltaproteobacteria bacterium]|nr:hypothetical protein [Deltaproteobacteria bacterium]